MINTRRLTVVGILAVLLLATGCTTKFTKYEQTVDGNAVDFSKLSSMKKGEACRNVSVGSKDDTLSKAAAEGKISKVVYVERKTVFSPLLIGTKFCTIAYGH